MSHKKFASPKTIKLALAFMVALSIVALYNTAQAKRDDENRSEFYGIVQSQPKDTLEGAWVIGGRTYHVDARTELDQTEGNLQVGSCAKVNIRNNRVHEIDSEPMRNCP